MNAEILHHGFDGLKFTIQTDIPLNLRDELSKAKAHAQHFNEDCPIEIGNMPLHVGRSGGSAFTGHTGELGAVWLFQDPEKRGPHFPGVTVDFRALLLATGGLKAAEDHFRQVMSALGIRFTEAQLRVTRVDYAVDILAPWFEPDRNCLVAPPGTKVTERTEGEASETQCVSSRVTGLRAGAVSNRQIAIYDKRAQVIQKRLAQVWLSIWNATRAARGQSPLDLSEKDQSQVWRFELRLGSKQLRNKFEMRSWQDLRDTIGDAFTDFLSKIRYCAPISDSNRARWPKHELWEMVEVVVGQALEGNRVGLLPRKVIQAKRDEKMHDLDRQLLGLFVTRAAVSDVSGQGFDDFMDNHINALQRLSREHPTPIAKRLEKAAKRYRLT